MPSLAMLKLIGGLVAALLLLSLIAERGRWMHRAHNAEAENATVCAAVRAAADNPRMDCKLAAQQVGLLGQAVADLKAGLATQTSAINATAAEDKRQKDEAARAVLSAATRARASQGQSARLSASARSEARKSAPCEPSAELKGSWQ